MKFTIEQLAICVPNPEAARALLAEMGAVTWTEDTVTAEGAVFGRYANNVANLSFNYQLGSEKTLEFEVLDYVRGDNWMNSRHKAAVSHLGMHCSEDALTDWRKFFARRGIGVAQEVCTQSHTNPTIRDSRRYTYVIFDTRHILGVDLKFIVRRELP
jgi:hypothetical protein